MATRAWDRLINEKEKEKQYQSFVVYRELKPSARTLRYACEIINNGDMTNLTTIARWAKRFRWAERAEAYDNEQLRLREVAEAKALEKVVTAQVIKREISASNILQETAHVGLTRITDVMDWDNGELRIKPSSEISPEVAAAIESIELRHDKDGRPIQKIKFHSKLAALDLLGRNQKLWGKDDTAPTQQNFVQFFLDVCKSGELEQEAKRRGLIRTIEPITTEPVEIEPIEAEVIEDTEERKG